MSPELAAEVRSVLADLGWLEDCVCSQFPLDHFFVQAGHTMPPAAMLAARLCPTRRQEVIWAYGRDIRVGYFGGLSGGQRAAMSLEQALDYIARDTAKARSRYRPRPRGNSPPKVVARGVS